MFETFMTTDPILNIPQHRMPRAATATSLSG
jgi:hypothetical protein